MYEPGFNSLLVEIDQEDAKWGGGNTDAARGIAGESYRKGTVVAKGLPIPDNEHFVDKLNPTDLDIWIATWNSLVGKRIIWNEGAEAGTTFDHDGKKYGFIYWHDVRGIEADGK